MGTDGVRDMLAAVGSTRIMFSSDLVHQIPVELAKYRSVIDDPEALERVLYRNVAEVYRLDLTSAASSPRRGKSSRR